MARKGSQQRNGLNRNTSNKKHKIAEVVDGCLSNEKERSAHDRKINREDVSNSDPPCGSGNHSQERLNNNRNTGNGKRNKQRSDHVPHKETLEDSTTNLTQPVHNASKARDLPGSDLLSDASASSRDDDMLLGSDHDINNSRTGVSEASYVHNLMDDSLSLIASAGKRLEALAFFILEATNGWLERQKPHLALFATVICDARDYICAQVKHVSPKIWSWLVHSGKLMLLLSMVWLDSAIRGLDSLLRLGTTSFLTVIWCSIFSIAGMIGITKMLIFTVLAALLVIFINFALAIVTSIIFSTVILWLYGSFWVTGFVILIAGVAFALSHERVALFVTTVYSMHCARIYTGWIGLLLGLNLSFITSDALIYFLKSMDEHASNSSPGQGRQNQGGESHFFGEPLHSSPVDDASPPSFARANERSPGDPSTSGSEADLTSESEVARLLNCNDHYSALGLTRYEKIDVTSLKREYRKKAMLVHPDKNMGNEKAAEAFKKLQNAYEVLLDSLKRKTYDDELRREELLNYFRRFHSASQNNRRNGIFSSGFTYFEAEDGGSNGDSRRIACNKCNNFHIWALTQRLKSQARWCQDCNEFHQAKDGDGWVEQAFHPLLFGLLHKMEAPFAYVCADSRIYDATEWFFCQGMRCPANTHKPSFHVNTSVTSKHNNAAAARGGPSAHKGSSGGMPAASMDEEELFEWLQNAVQSGMFEASSSNMTGESPSTRAGSSSSKSNNLKKKRKGKKQW